MDKIWHFKKWFKYCLILWKQHISFWESIQFDKEILNYYDRKSYRNIEIVKQVILVWKYLYLTYLYFFNKV